MCLAAVGRGGEKEKKVRVKERYHSTALLRGFPVVAIDPF